VIGIAFEDGFLLYVQRNLRRVHVLPDGSPELSGELSKLCFGFNREWTATKGSDSVAQFFNSKFA